MSQDIAIRAEGLSKRYNLGGQGGGNDSLRDIIAEAAMAPFRGKKPPKNPKRDFYPLKDISFEIKRGENVGLIGVNGAGKSTLLKILSRITAPTSGRAHVAGRVGALLEVGTGFHHELSGRENVFLYGAILGMDRAEVLAKFDAIVDFAEIEHFIDTPVKRYSSGMYVRLAFAVAAHLRPDILLLDEVLAVGDAAFQRKCMNFAHDLQRQNATIIFVSHNMFLIKSMCDRVILLEKGLVGFDGNVDAGIEKYEKDSNLSVLPWAGNIDYAPLKLLDMDLLDETGASRSVFDVGERITIRMRMDTQELIRSPSFMIAIMRSDGVGACVYANEVDKFDVGVIDGETVLELKTAPLKLNAEKYTIHVEVRKRISHDLVCAQMGRTFHVRHPFLDMEYGVFNDAAEWRRGEPVHQIAPSAIQAHQEG